MNNWFEVDKDGLAKLLANKPKDFVVHELLQNCWDEDGVTTVTMTLERVPGTPNVRLVVEDDSTRGFLDLTHAFSLYSPSKKGGKAQTRGRFNFGEKAVLSLASEATILSTTGGVRFDPNGQRRRLLAKRERGSRVEMVLRMTRAELDECESAVDRMLPPAGIVTTFNGRTLEQREPVATFETTLATELTDADGALTRTRRKTIVHLHEPIDGTAMIYELGIPVVETGDRWSIDVCQKVPLSASRDNVTPGYLAELRALVLEHMSRELTQEDANSTWVRSAIQSHGEKLPQQAIEHVVDLRFGDKRVAFDPSDREANLRAASEGYVVVHGSQLSREEWSAVRRTSTILPAGRVTPTPKPYSEDGAPLAVVPREKWTPHMRAVVAYFDRVAPRLLGVPVPPTRIVSDITWHFAATYGRGSGLTLNLGVLGHSWFRGPRAAITALLLHELGHHEESNHLAPAYHDALTTLGGKWVELALTAPELMEIKIEEACTC